MTYIEEPVPTDDGQPIRPLHRAEARVLNHLEVAAAAFREIPGVTPGELVEAEQLLQAGRMMVLARPAMEAYAQRLHPCPPR